MSSTTFVDFQTPITADWLNGVNFAVYGGGTTPGINITYTGLLSGTGNSTSTYTGLVLKNSNSGSAAQTLLSVTNDTNSGVSLTTSSSTNTSPNQAYIQPIGSATKIVTTFPSNYVSYDQNGQTFLDIRNLSTGNAATATLNVQSNAGYGQIAMLGTGLVATADYSPGDLIIQNTVGNLRFQINAGTKLTLDTSGNLIQSVNSTAPTLTVNKTLAFELTSDTQLKIKVRGSDGVTRSTTLTLA